MRIAVILSAYNGEKYIREQIDSILNQNNVNLELFIRDDGSRDSTVSILEEYEKAYTNVHINRGENIGFRKSFIMELLGHNGFDFYAFSDQDDFWEEEKLKAACEVIEKESSPLIPTVYYSNLNIADENLNVYRRTELEKRNHSLASVIMRRSIAGCTMVLNKSMWEKLAEKKISEQMLRRGHDSFIITLCYSIHGNVLCDSNAYIRYRQHQDNTSGGMKNIRQRIQKEWKVLTQKKGQEPEIAREILNSWGQQICDEERQILMHVANNTIIDRISMVLSKKFTTGDLRLSIASKIRVLLGMI